MKRLTLTASVFVFFTAFFISCGEEYPEIISAEYTGHASCKVIYSGTADSDTVFLLDGKDQRYTATEQTEITAGLWSGKTEVTLKVTPDFRPSDHITVTASGSMSGTASFDVPDEL